MTSLPSHTIVPTATGSGRFTVLKAFEYVAGVVVTLPIMADSTSGFRIPEGAFAHRPTFGGIGTRFEAAPSVLTVCR